MSDTNLILLVVGAVVLLFLAIKFKFIGPLLEVLFAILGAVASSSSKSSSSGSSKGSGFGGGRSGGGGASSDW